MANSLIKTLPDFNKWLQDNSSKVMGFDTETTSLEYLELEIIGLSLYNGVNACYVDLENKDPRPYFNLFVNESVKLVMHNAKYDLAVLKKYGFLHRNNACTWIAAQLVDGNKQHYGLKALAKELLNVKKVLTYEQAVNEGIHSPIFIEYATNDAIWTYELYRLFLPQLSESNQLYLYEEIEMPFQLTLVEMETNGVLLDPKVHAQFEKSVKEKIEQIEDKILAMFGLTAQAQLIIGGGIERTTPVNFNSSQQMVKLIERLGFEVDVFSEGGAKSIAAEYLNKHLKDHDIFQLLSDHASYSTLWKTYLNEYIEKYVDEDGRIRPSYLMAVSGRLRCTEPNLQNLPNPKKQKTEFNLRESYVAAPGYKFVRADWAGQELAVLGDVSQDANIIAAFAEGVDLHLLTANRNFNLGLTREQLRKDNPEFDVLKKKYAYERDKGKNGANFPIIYGTSPNGIAARQGVSKETAKAWMDGFFELYPGVKKAIAKVKRELEDKGFVVTKMGRIRSFPGYLDKQRQFRAADERAAFNHKIQGLSADICKIAANMMYDKVSEFGARIVLQVHDELVFEVPEARAQEFAKAVSYVMGHCVTLSCPLEVEVTIVESLK